MNTITCTTEIAASREQVFDLIQDESKVGLWMEGVEQLVFQENEKEVGVHFTQHVREGRHLHSYSGEIIQFDPPREYGIWVGNEAFMMQVLYTLEDSGNSCTLNYEARIIQANWFVGLLAGLFKFMTKRLLRRHMANLKQLAENGFVEESVPALS
ncbi:SRPBCC family protein [bacterium]|nr:SRPBCC family protein [bacterium]